MRKVNKQAKQVLDHLTAELKRAHPGTARKFDNGGEGIMAVHVDFLMTVPDGRIYSVAHYYEQNGDLMRDPDMTFLCADLDGEYYPASFRQDGGLPINQESITWRDGRMTFRPKTQRQHAVFAGQWMENIRQQQRLEMDIVKSNGGMIA